METIAILTTGGTIAMAAPSEGTGGAVPALHGADFLRGLPADLPPLQVEDIFNLPSTYLTLEHLQHLRQRVLAAGEAGAGGVVITHGTDTLEETAFYLDLTLSPGRPVVLTGAMRHASEPGYEGHANVADSIRTAACPAARGRGVLVVMNSEVHLARHVTKTHTLALDTFKSPFYGPLGRVDGTEVHLLHAPAHGPTLADGRLEPSVCLLTAGIAEPPDLLDFLLHRRGARGVVIQGQGAGGLPPTWLEPIRQAVASGMPVVIASRCLAGRITDSYGFAGCFRDLQEAGCLFADGLNGAKCRIKLMLALAQAGGNMDTVRRLWEQL